MDGYVREGWIGVCVCVINPTRGRYAIIYASIQASKQASKQLIMRAYETLCVVLYTHTHQRLIPSMHPNTIDTGAGGARSLDSILEWAERTFGEDAGL
jgi:hypothetical protein